MPREELVVSRIFIKLSGSALEPSVMNEVQEVIVDQHTHLPGMFTIRLHDPDLKLLDEGPFDLTKEVEVESANEEGDKVSLIKGEITALEPEFGDGMVAELVVRGYDKSHRLYRETKSKAYLNRKDSDLAQAIAGDAGLSPEVQTTTTVYDHIYQHNQSDLAFLMQRAWRIGYECFVEDGKLYFRKPPSGSSSITLKWGDDLHVFRPRMTLAEQVDEVLVKGWDPEAKREIVGRASAGNLYPGVGESKNGASWASTFGSGKVVIVDQPVVSQSEADALAAARLDEISGAFIEAEGEAFRRPDLRAGRIIKLEALGERFSGSYLVTNARHTYTPEGFITIFAVRGTRTGSLAEQVLHQPPLDRWPGLVVAVVSNTDDPKGWGRVKVKFPWMADDQESEWARVISAGAGPEAGYFVVPAVNDEVMVAFEHGDFNRPYVVGGVWNGEDAVPPEGAGAAEGDKPLVRGWQSRTGHRMFMYDNSEKKVEIVTAAGHTITYDDQNKKIEIKTSGGHTLLLDDQGKTLQVKSNGGLELTMEDNSKKITIKGGGDVVIEGQMNVNVKAGANMNLQATGNMDIKANGNVSIKGAMVNLN
jgi:phage protein D/phage baseplate assembly protein gpV